MQYIRWFHEISRADVSIVGGKNASLGEMIQNLAELGIRVPNGFALTADAYWYYLKHNNLRASIEQELSQLSLDDINSVRMHAERIQDLIRKGTLPDDLKAEIIASYQTLCDQSGERDLFVAVRSSATAEDLPTASFAGQQETFLYISGEQALYAAIVDCMASLFTERAILYRAEHGFDHMKVALSVGVQQMIRADTGSAGVAFSLDTETGHQGFVLINGAWGLGELVVQGSVVPDEYLVHKDRLMQGHATGIVKKTCGSKNQKLIYDRSAKTLKKETVLPEDQKRFVLNDAQIDELARAVIAIEKHYGFPMDVEWAVDGGDQKLYILQARPETVHAHDAQKHLLISYKRTDSKPVSILVEGMSIGSGIATGRVRILQSATEAVSVMPGDVIVTKMTDPDWMPVLKKASAVITQEGGRTCHAAIVSRELGITALVSADNCMTLLRDGQTVTLDCSQGSRGFVYDGRVAFEKIETVIDTLPKSPVAVHVIMSDPDTALRISLLPVSGVGLARLEFIITHAVGIHPMALVHPERVTDAAVRTKIDVLTSGFSSGSAFFIDTVGRAVALIAAAFYPRPVLVRLSDFKTNEYRNLLGGEFFEQEEENPMLGFRGASRYIDPRYADAFALECAALRWARETAGFDNIKIMVPFVRTLAEAKNVVEALKKQGLERGKDGLELYMMCEIPSNVLLIEQFAAYFDGFSIGSNDLTQLTLGVDRDSGVLSTTANETDPAVMQMMALAIVGAHKAGKPIGICGQAPSDYPAVAEFLIAHKIDSISLNADSVISYLLRQK